LALFWIGGPCTYPGEKAKNGFVYLEMRKTMYGLPQAGSLANKLLNEHLEPHGYREVPHTPGLWKHDIRPVQFSLVVDDFHVKYVGRENDEHLIQSYYNSTTSWREMKRESFTAISSWIGIMRNTHLI